MSAERNAGDLVSNAFLNSWGEVVGSGKSDTPWERTQSANLTAACWPWRIWAWVGEPGLDEVDELGDFDPHAAITVATAMAAAAVGRLEAVLNMTQVVPVGP